MCPFVWKFPTSYLTLLVLPYDICTGPYEGPVPRFEIYRAAQNPKSRSSDRLMIAVAPQDTLRLIAFITMPCETRRTMASS
eukprot:SAG31_NODE_33130_length_347_cov_1.044355_1_plen_80_part_10